MGHDEAPFLDGRGLRVGLAEPVVYPASLLSSAGAAGGSWESAGAGRLVFGGTVPEPIARAPERRSGVAP
jgi:hypothetical protein